MLRGTAVSGRPLTRERLIDEILAFMRRVGVEEAILYGSFARGEAISTSDVDLLVMSPRFAGSRPHLRLAALIDAWPGDLPPLEVLAYTPQEFEQARRGFGIERIADQEGIHLRQRGRGPRAAPMRSDVGLPGGQHMLRAARHWWTEAETSRRMAHLAAQAGVPSHAVLNARQAVEAGLKAAILQRLREEPPRTHSLVTLARQLREDAPDEVTSGIKHLDLHYITTRYPSDLVESPTEYYTDDDATKALEMMALVLEWVGTLLPQDEESGVEQGDSSDVDDDAPGPSEDP